MPYSSYNSEIISIYKEYFVGYSNIEERNNIKDKAVFVNDVSYLEKDDYKYLDYLIMIKEEKKLGEFELNTFKYSFFKVSIPVLILELSKEKYSLSLK